MPFKYDFDEVEEEIQRRRENSHQRSPRPPIVEDYTRFGRGSERSSRLQTYAAPVHVPEYAPRHRHGDSAQDHDSGYVSLENNIRPYSTTASSPRFPQYELDHGTGEQLYENEWYKDETKLNKNFPFLIYVTYPAYHAYKQGKDGGFKRAKKETAHGDGFFDPRNKASTISQVLGKTPEVTLIRCNERPGLKDVIKEMLFGCSVRGEGKHGFQESEACTKPLYDFVRTLEVKEQYQNS
ncbi:hypothetical protein BKA66DRAFT_565840 [Pyrenochaeta sp. MPI-SDFR-AT-0127]|nr:hypothetical protein BKA66DRAFT_565840 [Pyrenochaeta sp. MPI-SDFR-AT-0127]